MAIESYRLASVSAAHLAYLSYFSRFKYTPASELGNTDMWGVLAIYGGGGFVQYLSEKDMKESLESIDFLKVRNVTVLPYNNLFRKMTGSIERLEWW